MAKEAKKAAGGIRWRVWLGVCGFAIAGVSTALAGLKVRQFALNDPQFTLSRDRKGALDIQGVKYASRLKVTRMFATDFEHSIFSVPLEERRRRLLAVDWVEDATISRIWPDRLVVRISERKPVAFVFFRAGVLLIDARGVLLDPPPQAQFTFPVLSGIRENETESQRRERVRCLLRVQEELGSGAQDVSEVNAADPDNIRMVAQVDHRTVELTMGYGNFAARYRNFLKHFPEIEKSSPGATRFDLRLDDRILAED
ncbi:MAG TPA: FtsQ-type POTRA domain-containing protein [Bryobacteraceae bacterium]|jgi:cell division protein FtsQ